MLHERAGRRRGSLVVSAAVAAVAGGLWASSAAAQTAYTLNADGSSGNATNPTVYFWNTAPWTPAGFPQNAADTATINFREFTNVEQNGDAHVDIDLNNMSFTLGTLNLTESGTGNTDGDFQNGTLNLSAINYTSGGRELDFETSSTIAAGTNLLTLNTVGNTLDFDGAVTGSGGVTIAGTQRVALRAASTAITGAWTMNNTAGTGLDFDGAGGTAITLDSLTSNAAAGAANSFRIDRSSGSGSITVNVTGATQFNSPRINFQIQDVGAGETSVWNLNGVNINSPTFVWDLSQNTTVNIGGGFTDTSASAATFQGAGNLNINSQNTRTGSTTLQRGVWYNFGQAQAAAQTVFVNEGGAIGGEFANQTYASGTAPAPGVIVFHSNGFGILIDDAAPVNHPTPAQVGTRGVLRGVRDTGTASYTGLGAPGQIYGGVAFGGWTTAGDYSGDIIADEGDLRIYMATSRTNTPTTAGDITTLSTPTGIVDMRGPGNFSLNTRLDFNAVDGTFTTINRSGDAATQNSDVIHFDTVTGYASTSTGKALPAGKTVNVTDGRVRLFDFPGIVDNAATVNINRGATFMPEATVSPTSGRFNINAGGAFRHNAVAQLTSGATFTFAPGSILVLDVDVPDTAAAGIPTNGAVDFVVSEDTFSGAGLVLGNDRRLTGGYDENQRLVAASVVRPVAGLAGVPNNRVIFSAGQGNWLTIETPIEFDGVNLQINDPANDVPSSVVQNGGSFTRAVNANQVAGNVVFRGKFRAQNVVTNAVGQTGAGFALDNADSNVPGNIVVDSGVLYLGAGGPLGDGGIIPVAEERHLGNLSGRLTTTSTAVADRVAGNIILNGGTRTELGLKFDTPVGPSGRVEVTQPFTINGDFPADDRRFWISRRGGTVSLGVNLNNVTVNDGGGLAVDEDNTNVRVNTTFAGLTAATADLDDFDFINLIRGANLPAFNGTNPVVVRHGRVPGDTVVASSVFGTLNAGIRADMINGQFFFEDGSVLNGLVRAQTAAAGGDSFVTFDGVETGTPTGGTISGTGTVQVGRSAAGTTPGAEDVRIRIPEAATGDPLVVTVSPLIEVVDDGVANNDDGLIQTGRLGTDLATGVNGTGIFNAVRVTTGARGVLQALDGTSIIVRNISVAQGGVLNADGAVGDSRPHSIRGGGLVTTGDTGGGGAGGRERLIIGNNSGTGDVIAPGDSVGTLSLEQLALEDGFVYQFEANETAGDLVSILDPDGFAIVSGLASTARIVTDFVGIGSPALEYPLFSWTGADPAGPDPATLSGWQVTGEIPGTVQYRPDTNQIVLAVPEPGTAGLLALAGLGLLARRRRRA